jgi:DNA-binding CsgD family transcriptional regulator
MSSNGFAEWTAAKWSDSDIEAAVKLQSAGRNYTEIGRVLGRTNGAVRALFRRIYRKTRVPLVWAPDIKATGGRPKNVVISPKMPDKLAIEREARLEEPRTITMEFCGDPEPSRSALKRFCP